MASLTRKNLLMEPILGMQIPTVTDTQTPRKSIAAVAREMPYRCQWEPGSLIPVSNSATSRERTGGFPVIVTTRSTAVAIIMTPIAGSFSSLPSHGEKLRASGALPRQELLGLLSEQKTLIPMVQTALPMKSTGPSGAGLPRWIAPRM